MVANALIGAAVPFLLSKIFGSKSRKPQIQQLSTRSPQEEDFLGQLLGAFRGEQQQGPLGELFAQPDFEQLTKQFQQGFADPERRRFAERTAPNIREQFLTRGAGLSSSANDEIARQGFDIERSLNEALAKALFGAQQNQQKMQFDLLGDILKGFGRGTENVRTPGAPSTLQELTQTVLSGAAPSLGQEIGKGITSIFGRTGQRQIPQRRTNFSDVLDETFQRQPLPQFSTRLR